MPSLYQEAFPERGTGVISVKFRQDFNFINDEVEIQSREKVVIVCHNLRGQ